MGDLRAALGDAGFRGLTDVAGEDDDVLHGVSLVYGARDHPFDKPQQKPVGRRLHGWAKGDQPETPEGPGWSGQDALRPTRPGQEWGCGQETEQA